MACPYFMPGKRLEEPLWPHPQRLPLGGGYSGCCTAPGHEGAEPAEDELKEGCNLGYARGCPRLPEEREHDAVRFALARDREGKLNVKFVCESGHAPAQHGMLEFDRAAGVWRTRHGDARIQRMAECYVESYLGRGSKQD
ncbi:MAG: hypothetical protein ACR2IF_16405 [Terriglobales bacterium]